MNSTLNPKIYFYNTLSKQKEEFIPINSDSKEIGMYSCGPTVYNYAHIGNLRAYVFADILQKTLEYFDYKVKRVMNMTDVGHLTSDADDGEDKMVKALKRENKPFTLEAMKEVAIFYKEKFMEDLVQLNIKNPDIIAFASEHIKEQVEMIKILLNKGFAYKIDDGIYFEVDKFPDYLKLSGKTDENLKNIESRISTNSQKKNPADFALWKYASSGGVGFESELGLGFPGWHIECSAMSVKYLGEQFDIHTGGIDHISVHHTNEIAQSETVTDKKPFVKFWMHNNFLDFNNEKMAKSGDGFLVLNSVISKHINPLSYRFWLLMGHYRTKLNFNWEALEGADVALKRLYSMYLELGEEIDSPNEKYKIQFEKFLCDDLDTPKSLTLIWDILKEDKITPAVKKGTILLFDKVLSLGFSNLKKEEVPKEIQELLNLREQARHEKNFRKSDEIRKKINDLGYELKDTQTGQKVFRIN